MASFRGSRSRRHLKQRSSKVGRPQVDGIQERFISSQPVNCLVKKRAVVLVFPKIKGIGTSAADKNYVCAGTIGIGQRGNVIVSKKEVKNYFYSEPERV